MLKLLQSYVGIGIIIHRGISIVECHNQRLIMEGAPLRTAALGRNMEVVEVLMGFKELKVNLRGQYRLQISF